MATIDFYQTPGSPPCRLVKLVAAHLKIELNPKLVELRKGEHKTPEYLKLNPQHSVPTIDDNGFVLWESRAIAQYMVNQYAPDSPLYPKDPKKRATVDRVLQFDQGSLSTNIVKFVFAKFFGQDKPSDEVVNNTKSALEMLETFLGRSKYAAGDHLTLADLAVLASVVTLNFSTYDLSSYTKINTWWQQLKKELPYYDEVVTKEVEMLKKKFAEMTK